jgi:acetyltransferase-like isoleucine patch superfamily enzyme
MAAVCPEGARISVKRRPLDQFVGRIERFVRWKLLRIMPNDLRIRALRAQGLRIGERCIVSTISFSTEPYLIEIGNHVAISVGCQFITHDAAIWVFRDLNPDMDVFGTIKVGDNTYFGTNCTVLPNSTIGSNCIIGSGTVVRGHIPDGSVVLGNPGRVVMKTALIKHLLVNHKNRLDTHALSPGDKERAIRRHFGLADGGSGR